MNQRKKDEQGTILIVDDNPTNLGVLFDSLSHVGFKVLLAQDGERAIKQVERTMPDIILLDVLMPGIDGFETCRRLKNKEATEDIPIIFITALSDTVAKVKGFEVGGVDYITKPLQHEEVLARVNAHLTIRKLQKRLERQNEELVELNAMKDKFFSIIAHDLTNPFNTLIITSDFLDKYFDTIDDEKKKEFVRNINKSSKSSYKLLENLLQWSRAQTGRLDFNPTKVNIKLVVMNAINLLKPTADSKNIKLESEIEENFYVLADENMLNTIVRNLVSNALKFTEEEGRIWMEAKETEDNIEVSVSDTGIGIKDEDKVKLFRIDVHHTTIGTSREKGTGLGLILCKEFVERNGGKIFVESELGKGTTFRFNLPKYEGIEEDSE